MPKITATPPFRTRSTENTSICKGQVACSQIFKTLLYRKKPQNTTDTPTLSVAKISHRAIPQVRVDQTSLGCCCNLAWCRRRSSCRNPSRRRGRLRSTNAMSCFRSGNRRAQIQSFTSRIKRSCPSFSSTFHPRHRSSQQQDRRLKQPRRAPVQPRFLQTIRTPRQYRRLARIAWTPRSR